MRSSQDTIAAIATPLGEGGIGVLRISGAQAIEIADAFFESPRPLSTAPSHTCHFGHLLKSNVQRPKTSPLLDQAVATIFRGPHSYTGENVVEMSVHGSPYILQEALRQSLRHGARLAGPGEFTERAFLHGKLDLAQAEAVADLIRAKTDRAHSAALGQLEGHLSRAVHSLRARLMPLLAHIEVGLDHSDEDHDVLARATLAGDCAAVNARIDEILRSSTVGNILRDGLRVALLGRPNVGKSSLLNALLKEDRAIVTPIAGTTRDTLEESVDWDGIPVVLTDTAGLRDDAQDAVERAGITRARQAIERSDVAVVLFDHSQPLTDDDRRIVDDIQTMPHLWVANKSDLPAGWPLEQLSGWNGNAAVISVSARTGEGLDDLVRAVKSQALGGAGSAGDAQWMLNLRHRAALERAKESLVRAARAADGDLFEECVALELKAALDALGEIIGETTTDDLLGEIFSTFCVGK